MKGDTKSLARRWQPTYNRIMRRRLVAAAVERAIVRHRYFYLENSMRDISKQMNIPLRRVREALK